MFKTSLDYHDSLHKHLGPGSQGLSTLKQMLKSGVKMNPKVVLLAMLQR